MFKINKSSTYVWPVTVSLPADGGQFEKATFDAEFKRISQTRLNELQDQVGKGDITDAGLAREVLVGWRGVQNGDEDVPFSEAARDQLLDIPTVGSAVVLALIESLNGLKRKN